MLTPSLIVISDRVHRRFSVGSSAILSSVTLKLMVTSEVDGVKISSLSTLWPVSSWKAVGLKL